MLQGIKRFFAEEWWLTLRRFPYASFFAFVFFLSLFTEFKPAFSAEIKYYVFLSLAFYWCVNAKLFSESLQWNPLRNHLLHWIGIGGAFIVAAFCNTYAYWQIHLALVILLAVVPFVFSPVSQAAFWTYNKNIWLHLLFTTLVALVLFLGLEAIAFTVKYLLDWSYLAEESEKIFIFCSTLFAPFFYLSGVPKSFDEEAQTCPKPLRILLQYFSVPLLIVYAVILHIYTLKIMVAGDLPKGQVAMLVSWFACKAILTYLATLHPEFNNGFMRRVRHLTPYLLIVPCALLLVGIWKRIHDYGVTEERYFLILSIIWIIFSIAVLATRRLHEKFIPVGFVALLLATSAGPLAAHSVSLKSQLGILRSQLEKHHILQNERIVPVAAAGAVTFEDKKQISSIISYLSQRDELGQIRLWFQSVKNAELSRNNIRNYNVSAIVEDMGFKYISQYDAVPKSEVWSFNTNTDRNNAIDVKGFDCLVTFWFGSGTKFITADACHTEISYDKDHNLFSIKADESKAVLDVPADIFLTHILKFSSSHGKQADKPFILEGKNDYLHVRILIENANASAKDSRNPAIQSINGKLLLARMPKNKDK